MSKERTLSRRDFLKVGTQFLGAAILMDKLRFIPENAIETNERISDILSKTTPLGFDAEGNLIKLKTGKNGEDSGISLIPTYRNEVERNPMQEVRLLVVHYDGGERYRLSGAERTALNTVWGLNGNDPDGNGLGPTVQWCVDNSPIARNDSGIGGYGILQTQTASGNPLLPDRGLHVYISPIHPELDPSRARTVERFDSLGITSKLKGIVEAGITDFNSYAVGYEQIGTRFEERFPSDIEPPRLQFAHTLSLCIAAMRQFGLTPWDVVGHHEIQQKSDPGDYHMATLRFLLGVAALKGKIENRLVFGREEPMVYFSRLERYLRLVDRYGIYEDWNRWVGFDELVASLPSTRNDRLERINR
ncbi:hypothetical protein A2V61_00125 [Candidatus Woesebacteria bacterium RBG_19FT_COMBO_47_8]|nr:MAG: hypothetical protein A2V61_00125 [Candidatus Woesebacteria bacterium RBG_19FT_COMBO_47_8]